VASTKVGLVMISWTHELVKLGSLTMVWDILHDMASVFSVLLTPYFMLGLVDQG
jgi:hypothetical protein